MANSKPLALVAGAGAGLGQALCRRFDAAGMAVVGLGRTRPANTVGAFHTVDLTDADATTTALQSTINDHGAPRIVVHNTAELVIAPFEDTSLDAFQQSWASMVQSLFVLSQITLPVMVADQGGSLIVSGATASLRGGSRFAAFASAKFALRGLTQALAREYQTKGVHVTHVILDGIIETDRSRELHSLDPSKMMQTDDIADAYWAITQQPRSTWTHELDLRPASENF